MSSYVTERSTGQAEALRLFEQLVRDYPDQEISAVRGEPVLKHPFKAGAAGLEKIGRLRYTFGDVTGAVRAYQELLERYGTEEFDGDQPGEGTYGGSAGAQALSSLALIYSGDGRYLREYAVDRDMLDDNAPGKDCEKALKVERQLASRFGEEVEPCWEDCVQNGKYAAKLALECLEHSSLETWDGVMDFFVRQKFESDFTTRWPELVSAKSGELAPAARVRYLERLGERYKGFVRPDPVSRTVQDFGLEALRLAAVETGSAGLASERARILSRIAEQVASLPPALEPASRDYLKQRYREFLPAPVRLKANLFVPAKFSPVAISTKDVPSAMVAGLDDGTAFARFRDVFVYPYFQAGIVVNDSVWVLQSGGVEEYSEHRKQSYRISSFGDQPDDDHLEPGFLAAVGSYILAGNKLIDGGRRAFRMLGPSEGLPCIKATAAAEDATEIWIACANESVQGEGDSSETVLVNPGVAVYDRRSGELLRSFPIDEPARKIIVRDSDVWILGRQFLSRVDHNGRSLPNELDGGLQGSLPSDIAFDGDDLTILNGVGLFVIKGGKLIGPQDAAVAAGEDHLAAQGGHLFLWSERSSLRVTTSSAPIDTGLTGLKALAFSPDGRYAWATADPQQAIRIDLGRLLK